MLATEPLEFQWQVFDPFLFCVHHDEPLPGRQRAARPGRVAGRSQPGPRLRRQERLAHVSRPSRVPGFPSHPHRGFETVTVVRRGLVDHSDSLGAAARYGHGDVQWLTAGRGIVHAEMFPLLEQARPNPLELFQIWLNLPASDKFVDPVFLRCSGRARSRNAR